MFRSGWPHISTALEHSNRAAVQVEGTAENERTIIRLRRELRVWQEAARQAAAREEAARQEAARDEAAAARAQLRQDVEELRQAVKEGALREEALQRMVQSQQADIQRLEGGQALSYNEGI